MSGFPLGVKTPNRTPARDGAWYSIIGKHPRSAHTAKWIEAQQCFAWEGTSETKYLFADEVDEVLNEVDLETLDPGLTFGLL